MIPVSWIIILFLSLSIVFLIGIILNKKKELCLADSHKKDLLFHLNSFLELTHEFFESAESQEGVSKTASLAEEIYSNRIKELDFSFLFGCFKKQMLKNKNSQFQENCITKKREADHQNELQVLAFYKEAVHQLLKSIIIHISNTTAPISNELAEISQRIANFEKEMQMYKDEIKEKKMMKHLISQDQSLCGEIKNLTDFMKQVSLVFEKNMQKLNQIIERIHQKSIQIQDISEKVNVLSINTSIEASRAGANGKGFKVIAVEIKKLSDFSKKCVKEINGTILESKALVGQISKELVSGQKEIMERMNAQQTGYSSFYGQIHSFFARFETMYKNISVFIDSIHKSTGKINPVIQLHEITVQEMENLSLAIGDYYQNRINQMIEKSVGNKISLSLEVAKEQAFFMRTRLTTSRELDALSNTLGTFGLADKIDLNRDSKQIEFF